MKNSYPPAIIHKEHRKENYTALEEADHGDPQPFVQLVADEVKRVK